MLTVGGRMKSRLSAVLFGGASLMALATSGLAADLSMKDTPAGGDKLEWSAYVQGVSDYIFRGLSQNRRDPAVQGGVDVSYGMFYVGTFVSQINFESQSINAHVETDIYGGIKPKWGAVTFDFGVIGYLYPRNNGAFEQDYFEVKAGASTTVLKDVSIGGTFYYSPNSQNDVGATYVIEGTVSKPIYKYGPFDFTASATIGGFFFADDIRNGVQNTDYLYGNIGITTTFKDNFSVDFRWWDTNLDEGKPESPCGTTTFQCGSAFVVTAKASF